MKQRIVPLLAAALAARAAVPVPAGLVTQIWNIGTQLIILFSGLVLFSAAARAVFQRVSPSSNHGKTVFTLADSAIRYLLIIVGLLWALSIVGVDVRALLAGAGVLALIILFQPEIRRILEEMGLEVCGGHGTTAALALLNDAVKKGGVMASSSVGGLSGAFIPVSEDEGMIAAARGGTLCLDKL